MKSHSFLLSTFLLSFLSVSAAEAIEFTVHTSMDMPGFDIPENLLRIGRNPIDAPDLANCQAECDHETRCMAFTWVHSGVQGPTAKCWFKSSPRIVDTDWHSLMTFNTNTDTGVKIYQKRPCWARHIFNLKFCSVVFAGSSISSATLECPQGSTRVLDLRGRVPDGGYPEYCVARLSNDPGELPNCTDEFGGPAPGVLGSYINQACLDAN